MNIVDICLLLVVALAMWSGWKKGFILGLLDLVALAVSLFITFFLYPYVAGWMSKWIQSGAWVLPFSFIITYALVRLLIGLIMNRILLDVPEGSHQSIVNRLLGIVPGFINGIIYATALAALLMALPVSDNVADHARNSSIIDRLTVPAGWMESKLSPLFDEATRRTADKNRTATSDSMVHLSYTVKEATVRADLEERMLSMVNEERIKAGLSILKPDAALTQVARAHSQDMFARGYFSHITPENKGPFDRMKVAGIVFTNAGENLGLGQSLALIHHGLMHSPGHRANILRPQFGRLGIGILDGGIHGLMVTQNFRN